MAQRLKKVEGETYLYLDLDTGIFQVRATIDGKAYGPYSTRTTVLGTARKVGATIITRLQAEGAGKKAPTLAKHWESYRKRKTKSPRTWEHQDQLMRDHLLPDYGELRLNDFTKSRMEFYIQKRRKAGAADSTIGLELKVLMAVMNDAVDDGVLDRNPLRKMELPKIGIRQRVLTRDEQDRLEAVAIPEARRFLLFLLATGVRLEEAWTIQPSRDINWERHEFRVVGKGQKERWVPILEQSTEALRTIVTEQLELTGRDRLWSRSTMDAMREQLYYTCTKAGMEELGPHVMRHTFSTRYLEGGGDIYILSKILGHSSVAVTEKVYAHIKPRTLRERSVGVEVGVQYGGAKG